MERSNTKSTKYYNTTAYTLPKSDIKEMIQRELSIPGHEHKLKLNYYTISLSHARLGLSVYLLAY